MIQVLDRAMRIMELLGENPKAEYPLSDIAETLSIDKGTCARILKTLAARGFVQQEAPRAGYQMGYKLYHLTGQSVENSFLTKIARKDIEDLGRKINETALLSVIRNDKRVVLYSTVPERNIVIRTNTERNLYSVCAGRVILAHYTPSHLERCIIRLGLPDKNEWPEIYESAHPEQALVNALIKIKRNGYDILDDRHGIVGFAAPLFNNGHVVGSVGTYLPKERLTDTQAILDALLTCTSEINGKLKRSENLQPTA